MTRADYLKQFAKRRAQILKDVKSGLSYGEVAAKHGISRQRVGIIVKEARGG